MGNKIMPLPMRPSATLALVLILLAASGCASAKSREKPAVALDAEAPAESLMIPSRLDLAPGQQPYVLAVGPILVPEDDRSRALEEESSQEDTAETSVEEANGADTGLPLDDGLGGADIRNSFDMQAVVAETIDKDEAFTALIVEQELSAIVSAEADTIHHLMGIRYYIYGDLALEPKTQKLKLSLYLLDITTRQLIGTVSRRTGSLPEFSQSAAAGILEHVKNDIRIRNAKAPDQPARPEE